MNVFMNSFMEEVFIIARIREQKKEMLKEKILTAAREIFLNEGYEATTIEQIAKKAEVGLGTAYNYFKSKEELFLLAMSEELIGSEDKATQEYSALGTPSDIITEMVITNIKRLNFFSKKIWRVAMSAIFNSMKSNNLALHELMKADYRFIEKMEARLEDFKKEGRLKESCPIKTVVDLIYGSVIMNLLIYIYNEETTIDETLSKIETEIHFILNQ